MTISLFLHIESWTENFIILVGIFVLAITVVGGLELVQSRQKSKVDLPESAGNKSEAKHTLKNRRIL